MKTEVKKHFPHHTPAQIWRLAADVESYPGFLPWCIATRVLRRDGDRAVVDNVFGMGPVRTRFTSHAVFDEPRGLVITSEDGPFEHMRIEWRFAEGGDGGCDAVFSIEQSFRLPLLETLSAKVMEKVERTVVEGFKQRAAEVYGERPIKM